MPAVVQCVGRGVTVIQHDLDRGLPEFNSDSFHYVVLSQTLPEVRNLDNEAAVYLY